ncbi:uncharacterized protein [Clytia hemisphaerica]|uniref:ShKT domain-containing protein n=1 Tax=Clytia hemisphaerica TaxID=252671 RepID=A0A7M5V359_9CNID|eukprot:TCONS_00029783-protein
MKVFLVILAFCVFGTEQKECKDTSTKAKCDLMIKMFGFKDYCMKESDFNKMCRLSCGFCVKPTTPMPTPKPDPKCKDTSTKAKCDLMIKMFGFKDYCMKESDFNKMCQLSCGFCVKPSSN